MGYGLNDAKIVGLLYQVIRRIPEELRRELSRLDSKATLPEAGLESKRARLKFRSCHE
jgi:hypothetical protein